MRRGTGPLGCILLSSLALLMGCIVEPEPEENLPEATPTLEPAEETQPANPPDPTPTARPGEPTQTPAPDAHKCGAPSAESDNSWPAYEAPSNLTGTGGSLGDVLADFQLTDQFGDEVSLYQFYGMVIMIEVGAEWCPYCNATAASSQELLDMYQDDCVEFVYLLTQDVNGDDPTTEVLARWADKYSLDYPVLADPGGVIAQSLGVEYLPMFYFIDRHMVLQTSEMGAGNIFAMKRDIDDLL